MITISKFKKLFPEIDRVETAHELITRFQKTRSHRWNHPQNVLIEKFHRAIGMGGLNKSCGSCMATGADKIIKWCDDHTPKKAPKVTPKASEEDVPTNYMALKKYAQEKLGKKFPKGTTKKEILKELEA